jgi:23S rRNA pseudouridine2605 synthase
MKQSKKPPNGEETGLERVQKVLSRCGVASRRAAEALIRDGRIEVNGAVVSVGDRMRPGVDELRFDGEVVPAAAKPIVLLLNKPVGTLCSEKDPDGRRLVHHLVPPQLALRLVGRLDFNTEGVLLLTNDGELSNRLSHPRHGVLRVYEARVRGIPTRETLARLIRGVMLDDGPARVESARVVKSTDKNAWVRLTLTEGRNREVRRLMEKVGHPVMRLRRVQFAGLSLDGMLPSQWRVLYDHEVAELRERGHVGAFELPHDPRGQGLKKRSTASVAKTVASKPSRSKKSRQPQTAKTPPKPTRRPPKPSRKSAQRNPGNKR